MLTTDNFIYNAGQVHFVKMDEAIGNDRPALEKFYDRFIQGTLDAATNGKLITKRFFDVSKYQGEEFTYTVSLQGIDNFKIVKRVFLFEKKVYYYEMWALDGNMDQKKLEDFFGSIEIAE